MPPGTIAVARTDAAPELELVRLTIVPEGPDFPFKLMVPVTVVDEPPTTLVGATVIDRTPAGRSVRVQFFDVGPSVAVSVVMVFASTPRFGTGNVVDVAPLGTVTVAGGTRLGEFELSATTVPPTGAGALSVTVPVG